MQSIFMHQSCFFFCGIATYLQGNLAVFDYFYRATKGLALYFLCTMEIAHYQKVQVLQIADLNKYRYISVAQSYIHVPKLTILLKVDLLFLLLAMW